MKKLLVVLVMLAAARLAFPAEAAAPTVSLGNAVLEVAVGQTAPLSVAVTDVQGLYGLEIHLRFDPAVVQVADADPGKEGIQVAAGDFLSADFVAQNRVDNQAGTIDYAVTQVNPKEPRSGSGTLLLIRFQGGAAGRASQLEVTNGHSGDARWGCDSSDFQEWGSQGQGPVSGRPHPDAVAYTRSRDGNAYPQSDSGTCGWWRRCQLRRGHLRIPRWRLPPRALLRLSLHASGLQ